jgi:predicted amidophosphoribosyltransferase
MGEHARATSPHAARALVHPARILPRVLLDVAFPLRCVGCGQLGSVACAPCRTGIESAPANPANAPWSYDGFARDLIGALKYRNTRAVAALAAVAMAERLAPTLQESAPRFVPSVDAPPIVVTWAPTSGRRRRERGYDQAELLARQLAARIDAPVVGLLARVEGRAQTGRERAERLIGPRFTIASRQTGRSGLAIPLLDAGPTVVLVDDVVTTGATLAAAAACLLNAGTARVVWSAAAATPDGNRGLFGRGSPA